MKSMDTAVSSSELSDLRRYLDGGKLMCLSTTTGDSLAMCSVWYAKSSDYRRIYFTSRVSRDHSVNIRNNGLVSGAIVTIELEGLGQKAQGVFFKGMSVEATHDLLVEAYETYKSRWPQVETMFSLDDIRDETTPMRMYSINVEEYVWLDEVGFPSDPKRIISVDRL